MILALDIGNTNIVVGCVDNGEVIALERIRTERGATSAEYAIKFSDIIHYMKLDEQLFEGSIISSVVPEITASISEALRKLIGAECLVIGPGIKTGLNVLIDDPSTLGADLAVGGVAAICSVGKPAIIIDMGTATTVTLVDKNGAFRGGAIVPGLKLGLNAMAEGTSLLPDISILPPKKAIGTNTVECMRSGAVYGTAAMIDGLIDKMEAEIGYKCNHVATGGTAGCVIPFCSHKDIVIDDNLLLKGLWEIYKKNIQF